MSVPLRLLLAGLLLLLASRPEAAAQSEPLRLCADPHDLPFSSQDDNTPGIYIELGRQIATALGRPFEPVWTLTYFGKHQVRTTLLSGKCDGFIGLPEDTDFMGPRVIFSKPLLALGYALVTPRAAPLNDVADLVQHRVAVQYASPPQSLLSVRNDVQTVTVLSPEEAMRDLSEGKVDAAFIWGPSAGWINHTEQHDADQVIPVTGPHMQWQAAIGFASDQAKLRDAVDGVLAGLGPTVATLMAKYGFPAAAATSPAPAGNDAASGAAAAGGAAPAAAASAAGAATARAAAGDGDTAAAGHKLFNDNCAHCHGPDAVEGERRRNLRLLHHLFGDDMDHVFINTVTHGRPAKGMPNWSGVLTDAQFHAILTYLHSVQQP